MSTSLRVQADSESLVSSEPLRPYLSIHALNVFVRDQEKSLQFYRDQLGFELAFDAQLQTGQRWVAVAPPDGTAVIALIAPEPESSQYKLIGQPTGIVFVTEDVPAKYIEWSKRGVRFRHTPRLRRVKYERRAAADLKPGEAADHKAIWGGVFTRFEDIDQNSFALVSFDEVTREVEVRRRAVLEKLESERRVAQEMEIAKQVQSRLFPQNLPPLQTLEYAGVCMQARQVGGDYYDFLHLGQDRLGLVVGDVSGKGIAAALLMANLQANLRSQCAMAVEHLERLLQSVNQLFYENSTENAYATLFFAEYDDRAQRMRYANCGHLCGLVLRGDESIERLGSTAMVLGLFKNWDCEIGECELFAGDTFALYTDGMTEAFDHRGEEFGEERLAHALCRHKDLPAAALLDALLDEVKRFSPREQHDDITLLIAKCCGNKELQGRLVY
jgi:serine phosphatase RsbU (regulator of sigma subunit)/catechol 2,3-dioxygenase-like lactoylglutathione lyase family enzyme